MSRYLLCLLLILCGCSSPLDGSRAVRACDEIQALEFRALLGQHELPDQVRVKLSELFAIPLDAIEVSSGGLNWTSNGVQGAFVTKPLLASEDYQVGVFEFQEKQPSIEAVLGCLGTPDLYGAWYFATPSSHGQPIFMFDMYYIQQGVMARVLQANSPNHPPQVDGKTQIQQLIYVNAESPEKTLERLTFTVPNKRKEKIKPWPGSWDKIEIEIEPSAR